MIPAARALSLNDLGHTHMKIGLPKEKILQALASRVPPEMKALPQWVLWRSESANGRTTKIPYQASGAKAKSTDPATWCGFTDAVAACRDGDYSGVGICLTRDAGVVAIDLDHCRNPDTGEIVTGWARDIVEYANSYCEVSPSGDGYHIFCGGTIQDAGGNDGCETSLPHMEMYCDKRYMTLTGQTIDGYDVFRAPPEGVLLEIWDFMKNRKPSDDRQHTACNDRQRPHDSGRDEPFVWDGDIDHLPIKASTKDLILSGVSRGQRSESIQRVLNALVYANLSDEQIFGIFRAYEIGQKWRDEKRSRETWLQPQINKARSFVTGRATARKSEQRDYQHPDGDSQPPSQNRFSWARDIQCGKPKWVVPGYIEENGFGLLFGDPGSYKSFIAIDWGCHVATGTSFYGRPVKQGVVVIIAGEGIVGAPRRIRAWCYRRNADFTALPVAVSRCPSALTDAQDTDDTISNIRSLVGEERIRLIIVDTVARNYGGMDENSTQDMSTFIQACDRLRKEFDTAVLAVHHCGQGDKTRGRGSIALKGALDCEYRISRDSENNCLVHCTKMKEFSEPPDMMLKPIAMDLGEFDENGDAVTSLAFERIENYIPQKRTPPAAGNGQKQKIMTTILKEMIAERDKNLVDSGRDPEGCVLVSDWMKRCQNYGVSRKNFCENKPKFRIENDMVFGE